MYILKRYIPRLKSPKSPQHQSWEHTLWTQRSSQDEILAPTLTGYITLGNLLLKLFLVHSSLNFSGCTWVFLVAQTVENLPANAEDMGLIPGSGRSPGEGNGYPFQSFFFFCPLVFLHGEVHGQRSLGDYSKQGDKESDMIKQLTLSLFTLKMGKIPTLKV